MVEHAWSTFDQAWLSIIAGMCFQWCITRLGIRIGDRKYLNEYTPFGSVSLCITALCHINGRNEVSVFHYSIHEDEVSPFCKLGDQPNKAVSAKSATRGGKRSPTGGSACHNVCMSTKHIAYIKVSNLTCTCTGMFRKGRMHLICMDLIPVQLHLIYVEDNDISLRYAVFLSNLQKIIRRHHPWYTVYTVIVYGTNSGSVYK